MRSRKGYPDHSPVQTEVVVVQRVLRVLVCTALVLPTTPGIAQTAVQDPDVAQGIKLVEDGEYDAAIVRLDRAARRLAQDPKQVRDLSQAYLYLGIAYIGKGQEAAARAKFREALQQAGDLTLSPEKFPPKVINLFEAARDEVKGAGARAASPSPKAAAAKKGGAGKVILVGLLAAGAGGAALAAGGGGGGSSPSPTASTPAEARTMLQFSGTVASQEQRFHTFTASRAGAAEVRLAWQDGQISLSIDCQESLPPFTSCGGQLNRTTNTTALYVANVQQKEYLVVISNFSSRSGAEAYTVQIFHP